MPKKRNSPEGLKLVYEYGCGSPIEGEEAVIQEMFLRNKLRNQLVEIEHNYRKQRDPLVRSEVDVQIDAIKEKLQELCDLLKKEKKTAACQTIKAHRAVHLLQDAVALYRKIIQDSNTPVVDPTPRKYDAIPGLLYNDELTVKLLAAAIAQLRKDLYPLYAECKTRRAQLFEVHATEIKGLNDLRVAAVKDVSCREASKLYWCNSGEILDHYRTERSKPNLRFHRFEQEGKITIRRSDNFRPEELFGNSSMVSMQPIDPNAWDKSLGRKRKKLQWTTLRILVNKDEKNNPIFFRIPVCIHRPIPANAVVTSVSVIRRELGITAKDGIVKPKFCYRVTVGIRLPVPEPATSTSTTVLKFCSRLNENASMTVAEAETGRRTNDIVLPPRLIQKFRKIDDLKGILAQYQNEAQSAILALLARKNLPSWFMEATEYVAKWHASQHYLDLLQAWKGQRFKGDDVAYLATAFFQERYIHLQSWIANQTDNTIAWRREIYRTTAARLAKNNGTLILGDTPPAAKAKKKAETQTAEQTNKRKWKSRAALYSFKSILTQTAKREGVAVKESGEEAVIKDMFNDTVPDNTATPEEVLV